MKKIIAAITLTLVMVSVMTVTAFANVSGVIEQTWGSANTQIREVVDNVVFPALSLILVVAFFVKVGTAYFDYRKSGQFEFIAPAILFFCLVFTITAPLYIWDII